jgi:hypothetical protein
MEVRPVEHIRMHVSGFLNQPVLSPEFGYCFPHTTQTHLT